MGSAKVTIDHAAVVGNDFLVFAILVVDAELTVFLVLSLLDCAFFAEEFKSIFKGDTRNTLKTFNNF